MNALEIFRQNFPTPSTDLTTGSITTITTTTTITRLWDGTTTTTTQTQTTTTPLSQTTTTPVPPTEPGTPVHTSSPAPAPAEVLPKPVPEVAVEATRKPRTWAELAAHRAPPKPASPPDVPSTVKEGIIETNDAQIWQTMGEEYHNEVISKKGYRVIGGRVFDGVVEVGKWEDGVKEWGIDRVDCAMDSVGFVLATPRRRQGEEGYLYKRW